MKSSLVRGLGLYTIVTQAPFIVVDGILASPFESSHFVANKFYDLHRSLHALDPTLLKQPWVRYLTDQSGIAAEALLGMSSVLPESIVDYFLA